MVVTFADISHYQTVDLAAYAAAGYDRIVMKATGGALDGTLRFADPTFAIRWREAGRLGLARVAYHFARNNNTGGDEFAWFLSQVQAAGGVGPRDSLCYDQEDNRNTAMWGLARKRTREFTAAAVRAGFDRGMYYSGRWFTGPAGITAADLPPGWRNFWISDTSPDVIELPAGWTREHVVAVQFTDHANLPGIPGTDANRVIREWLQEDSMALDPDAKAYIDGKFDELYRVLTVGDAPTSAHLPETHPNSLETLREKLDAALTDLAAVGAKVDGLAAGGGGDPAAFAAQVAAHLKLVSS